MRWRVIALLSCVLLIACGEEDGAPSVITPDALVASDIGDLATDQDVGTKVDGGAALLPCEFLDDGICDEPVGCPLLSDEADCALACDDPDLLWRYAAACAARTSPSSTNRPTGRASGGNVYTSGTLDRTIEVALGEGAGVEPRHYRIFVPPQYSQDVTWPLMVMLPGHRVDIYSLAEYTALEAAAEANGFILVYAEQEWRKGSFRWAWWTDWNWAANPSSNPDIQFMRDLVSDVGAGWNIDLNRVYAVGHSRGGAMAFILALEAPDLFAAVCSQSGFTEFGYDQRAQAYVGTRRTPVMLVHGTLDSDVQVGASDKMNSILSGLGWTDAELVYLRLENVAHRWQPWLNQQMWDFLSAQSLDGTESP